MTPDQYTDFTPMLVRFVDAVEDSLIRSGRAQTFAWAMGDVLYQDDAFRNQVLELFNRWGRDVGQD